MEHSISEFICPPWSLEIKFLKYMKFSANITGYRIFFHIFQ